MAKKKLYCNFQFYNAAKTNFPFRKQLWDIKSDLQLGSRLCALEAQVLITILVPGGVKLGKEVFVEEGIMADSRSFTYLGETSLDVFSGFGSQHLYVMGQDLCVAIGNLPLFQRFLHGYLLRGEKVQIVISVI